MNHQCSWAILALAAFAGLLGCGRELHPVGGKLVWEDGKPVTELEGALVYFESQEHRTVSRSVVTADGQFQLTTDTPESSGPDGVPPGEHRVYVVDGLPSLLEVHFRDPETSGLRVTVPLEGPIELKIKRAPASRTKQRAPTRDDER